MRLTIEQPKLAHALEQAVKATPSRTNIPALSHVLFEATDDLRLTATDLDVEVSNTTEANINAPGFALIPAKMVLDVVKQMEEGKMVDVSATENRATFRSGRTKIEVSTLPPEDFPHIASAEYDCTFTIPSHTLADLFGKVKFAVSKEETRYYLNGVYMHHEGGKLHTVATDGHRLAKWATEHDAEPPAVIVPSGTLSLITPPDGSEVVVSVSEAKIKFEADGWSLVSKVIDGTFPDYTRVVPTSYKTEITSDARAMAGASGRVETAMEGKARGIALGVSADGIAFTGRSADAVAEDFVDADVDGPDVTIGVNSKYISAIMSHVEGDAVLQVSGAMDSFKILDSGDPDWFAVLMPMRV